MYWLRPPPYLRWALSAILILAALWLETRSTPAVRYPFAAESVHAGVPLEEVVEWREIPRGILPAWSTPVSGPAAHEAAAGEPLLPSIAGESAIPAGWWAVAIPLPASSPPGSPIRVLLEATGAQADGRLVSVDDDGYEHIGIVAFPAETAPLVAAAAGDGSLVVMVGTE